MHQDYHASELNGNPNEELPSYEEVWKIYELMYDSFLGASNGPGKAGNFENDPVADMVIDDIIGSMSMDYDDEISMSMGFDIYGSMSMQYTSDDGMYSFSYKCFDYDLLSSHALLSLL